jgi:hypothetical protein
MDSFGKTQITLLTWTILCAGVTSCRPSSIAPDHQKSERLEAQTDMGMCVLSKEQIIAATDAAVRLHGYNPKKYRVIYDEGAWRSKITAHELEGHDVQLVVYRPRAQQLGGELWVVIDRKTGDVLKFIPMQ